MRELHELLRHYAGSEQRYKDFVQSMRNSTLTAFYTPPAIVRALAEALRDAGVVPRRLLDPSAGAGIFPSSFRETADGEVEILSFEKDLLTGQVLSALAREREQVVIDGFQTIESAYDSYFDVVTSNIPFGDTRIFDASFRKSDDPVRRQALKAVHNYFFIKGLDTLREGGILAFVTSAGVMDAPGNEPVRRYLMEHARLLSAVRLPNNLFTEYAGTEVASDLVVLQKQSEKRKLTPDEQRFVSSSEIGNGIYLNDYHRDFKHAIHTTFSHEKGLYGQSALVLHYDGGPERIAERLRGILANAFAARLDTERYTQYLRPLHIPQAQTVPPTARRQNRVAAPQSVAPPEPASVAPTPEISAPAASLFGSAAEKRCGRSRYFRSRCNGCRLRWRHGLRSRDPILPPGGRRHGLRLRDMERTEILRISFGVETGCESICEDSAQPLGDPFRASVVVQDESGLSIETFFMRKRRMDRVLEIPVVVVQVNSVADLGRTDEALLVGGKLPLFALFL